MENDKILCDKWGIEFERKPRRKKRIAGENIRDAGLWATDQIKRVMKEVLDRLHKEINDRFSPLFDIDVKFGFLLDVQRLCYIRNCGNLELLCDNLASVYSDDLDGKQLYGDVIDCQMLISSRTTLGYRDLKVFFIHSRIWG